MPETVPEAIRTSSAETDMTESELEAAEAVIDRGRRAFLEVGEALLAIRGVAATAARLRPLRGLRRRIACSFGRRAAYWHIDAAQVARNVQHVAHAPPTDALEAAGLWRVASLATLPPEQQRDLAARDTFTSYTRQELRAVITAARAELSSRPRPPANACAG